MIELEKLRLTGDSIGDWYRNIVSLRQSVSLMDSLADDEDEAHVLVEFEMEHKPYQRVPPIIERDFEMAEIWGLVTEAINYPFEHPNRSRFSDGSYGVWYGAETLETSIYETAHHYRENVLAAAHAQKESVVETKRMVMLVRCGSHLLDLRSHLATTPNLVHPTDYTCCQHTGRDVAHEGHPGLLNHSARREGGQVATVFQAQALSDPRNHCYLTYKLDVAGRQVTVEREPGQTYLTL